MPWRCRWSLVDLLTPEGVTGSAYAFCYTPAVMVPLARLVANLEPVVRGELLAPLALERRLRETFRLRGGSRGLSGMAVATIDMAAWDALARALGLPLVRLLGGEPRPLPAYNSLGRDGAEVAAADAEAVTRAWPGTRRRCAGTWSTEPDPLCRARCQTTRRSLCERSPATGRPTAARATPSCRQVRMARQ